MVKNGVAINLYIFLTVSHMTLEAMNIVASMTIISIQIVIHRYSLDNHAHNHCKEELI